MTATLIDQATHDDVDQVTLMADGRRREYELRQPLFWRQAKNALTLHRTYLHGLVDDPAHIFLVAGRDGDVVGFVIGRLVPAPPVYDPGGLTCAVDDFAVAAEQDWSTVGVELLRAVARRAQAERAVQVVVVAGAHDLAKGRALRSGGLMVASEWWVAAVDSVVGLAP